METKIRILEPENVKEAYQKIFQKLCVNNLHNRLRELKAPSENDIKRWGYELLQNAKDSIAGDHKRSSISISISTQKDVVEFKHNGAPFTPEAMFGLLYKYSDGKENQESIGRFGTGFLTTHCLSRVVSVLGDLYLDNSHDDIGCFAATIYREGENGSELFANVEATMKSLEYSSEPFGFTSFRYNLKSKQNQTSMRKGIKSLSQNIVPTMLFCKEIDDVIINSDEISYKYQRISSKKLGSNIFETAFNIINISTSEIKKSFFIHSSIDQEYSDISKKYKKPCYLLLMIAIEVDEDKNIIEKDSETPLHFCVFPLVGSEKQLMPILINSSDFEPDSERKALILDGNEYQKENHIITETRINRKFL
jgi:hypothetical protein